jgi:alkanesulfonate monooxygenase SsuD/methylene tetrahydromethanopterin reductase-like flavin-dependent oxidoreductase (luciferase family)
MAGMADAVLRRIARIADGWLPRFQPGPEARELLDRLRGYIREAGRAVDAVGLEGRLSLAQTPEEHWATVVQQWRDLDVDYLGVNTMGAGLASPQAHIDAIRRFKEAADRAR